MPFDTGTIIAIAAALLFYLRLIVLQRQRAKKTPSINRSQPWIEVKYNYLVGFGVLLLGIGAVMAAVPWFGAAGRAWWWAPVTLGILLMGLGIR